MEEPAVSGEERESMDEASTGAGVDEGPDTDSGLTEPADDSLDQLGWSLLSEAALQRVWDNEEDAVYDHWRELYSSIIT